MIGEGASDDGLVDMIAIRSHSTAGTPLVAISRVKNVAASNCLH
jgi:hypothetical protein